MSTPHVPLSILDLVSVSEGQSMREAIGSSMELAQAADRLGYERYWYAEHHNSAALGSSATALLIDRAASLTRDIRVGSGGIMLPNHAPLAVAEQFGTLVQFHGDRIDLGLGRAPGTDPITSQLLARSSAEPDAFMESVDQIQRWTGEPSPRMRVRAGVAEGTNVPMWVLGSTVNGATLAGRLGLPFSIASHFAPTQVLPALERYRAEFNPEAGTAQISEPRVMVAANVALGDTDEEGLRQFTTLQRMFAGVVTGERLALQPPEDPEELAARLPEEVLLHLETMLSVSAVGSPQTVVEQLESLIDQTDADELILTAYAFDPAHRVKTLELLAPAWGLTPRG
ncbi:LLM class flavin-dependent oxidoreductase [Parenemella sanctibonifatiensis]|uniref:Alkane 1-monooxygenase n=1 Tax=Parenemella sanctibonifatiensis TaxID=2016505 RepID=A0A255ELC2_9ACTN|nr:LLM class flavin-dependent oxidoreductase [Parenemella sanctibonifatiensis]OYN90252.1 alkane 1-monooxygenase [Parenemella sanctibonifatiensis]